MGTNEDKVLGDISALLSRASVSAQFQQAATLMQQGNLEGAESLAQKVLHEDQNHADASHLLGYIAIQREQYELADRLIGHAISINPGNPTYHCNLALALQSQGKYDQAIQAYEQVIEQDPDYENAVAGLAGTLERLGKYSDAENLLRPFIERNTGNLAIATTHAIILQRLGFLEDATSYLEDIPVTNAPITETRNYHFTLGDLYDKSQRYTEAFTHYEIANKLKGCSFDRKHISAEIDKLIDTFSAQRLTRFPTSSNTSSLPVFIVGMPRSGTSLVEQIISSHPQAYGAGELSSINRIAHSLPTLINGPTKYAEILDALSVYQLDKLAESYLFELASLSGEATRVTDKMPYNYLHLGLIQLLFPGSRIIHCTRNPIDTCLSCYFKEFVEKHDYAYNLYDLGYYYSEYLRLMQHWSNTLSIPILEVKYESLVTDQAIQSRRLIKFCRLEWDDKCLDFHKSSRITKTSSYEQVRNPIYRSSLDRWKNYEEFIAPLEQSLSPDMEK